MRKAISKKGFNNFIAAIKGAAIGSEKLAYESANVWRYSLPSNEPHPIHPAYTRPFDIDIEEGEPERVILWDDIGDKNPLYMDAITSIAAAPERFTIQYRESSRFLRVDFPLSITNKPRVFK